MGTDSTANKTLILLHGVSQGDREAADHLMERLHSSLSEMAEARLRGDPLARTVDPASLVSEVYLRLVGGEPISWNDRVHFLAAASDVMRRTLLDLAKSRDADKRGGGWRQITLSGIPSPGGQTRTVDMEALERALSRLVELDPRQARVVEMRFYSGMTEEEVAEALSISRRSVQLDWAHAKAWLKRELSRDGSDEHS